MSSNPISTRVIARLRATRALGAPLLLGHVTLLALATLATVSTACGAGVGVDISGARGQAAAPLFVNGDFELDAIGTTPPSGWTLTTYLNAQVSGTATAPPASVAALNLGTAGAGKAETFVVGGTNWSQFDPDLGAGQTFRYPIYGTRSARVNYLSAIDNGKNRNVNMIRQSMTVSDTDLDPTDGQVHVRFVVAPVLENPAHTFNQQPYFYVELYSLTRGLILFSGFNTAGQAGVPWHTTTGVRTGNATQWLDWQLVDIAPGNAALAIGDQVQVTVIGAGCSLGGHFGRIYVDGMGASIPGPFVTASGPQSASVDTDIVYTLKYRNGATTSVTGAHVDMTMPPYTTFQAESSGLCTTMAGATPTAGYTGIITCPVGTLAAGASGSFTVTVHIDALATGSIVNGTYSIGAINAPTLLGSKVITKLAASGSSIADIQVTKTSSRAAVVRQTVYTNWYTITIKNNGPVAAPGGSFTFTDLKSSRLSAWSAGNPTYFGWSCAPASGTVAGTRCSAASASLLNQTASNISLQPALPVGGEITILISARVRGSAPITAPAVFGTTTNTATVTIGSVFSDPDLTNNSSSVTTPYWTAGTTLPLLTVTKVGTADGSVSSAPAGINCPSGTACSPTTLNLGPNTTVILTATAAPGSSFAGWSGACTGTAATCSIAMGTTAKAVTATFNPPPPPAAAAAIYVYSGSNQLAATAINAVFALPLVALVTDAAGLPVANATVDFAAVPGGSGQSANLSAASAQTNAVGLARVTATGNATPGTYAVTAMTGAIGPATFALTNVGPPASMAYVTGGNGTDPQQAPIGSAFPSPLVVIVRDAAGNPVPGVTVGFTVPASGASAILAGTSAVTDASGQASMTASANMTLGLYSASATLGGLAAVPFTLQNIAAGPAAVFVVSGSPQVASPGNSFNQPLVVVVADAGGNALAGVIVDFAVSTVGGATANLSSATATTDASGLASVTATANATAGAYTVTASVSGAPVTAVFALANDGGQSITPFNDTSPQEATVNTAFNQVTPSLQAYVVNTASGTVPNPGVWVTFTASTGAGIPTVTLSAYAGTTTQACTPAAPGKCLMVRTPTASGGGLTAGVAAITATANTVAGGFSVTATTPNAPSPASFALENLAGAAAAVTVVSGTPQTAKIGTAFAAPLIAKLADQYGNGIALTTVTFTAPGAGASAGLSSGSVVTDAVGLVAVTATANATAGGPYSVTAASGAFNAAFLLTNTNGCASNADCTAPAAPTCNTGTNNCGVCLDDAGCAGHLDLPACQPDGSCGACSSTNMLMCGSATPVCKPGTAACVACVTNADCTTPASPACDAASNTCGPCSADAGCVGHAGLAACQAAGRCGECSGTNATLCLDPEPTCNAVAGVCAAAPCSPDLVAPANGSVSGTTGVTGDVRTYACNVNYTLSGSASTTCLASGAWSASAPTCVAIVGACISDGDCGPSGWCDPTTLLCVAKLVNGAALPTLAGHTPALDGLCSAGAALAVCTSGVCDAADNRCGLANGTGPCTTLDAAQLCRSQACAATGIHAGTCVECAITTDCSGALAVCDATLNVCVQCTPAESAACVGATPACAAGTSTCAACGADFNTAAAQACPSAAAPLCVLSGAQQGECGRCASADDCLGHAGGALCDPQSGACTKGCGAAADCDATSYCTAASGLVGFCAPKLDNGQPLPSVPTSLATCTPDVGAIVCVAGVCDAADNQCGLANASGPCASASVCRGGACDGDGLCGLANGNGPCTAAQECRSALCGHEQVCTTACTDDAACPAAQWCTASNECAGQTADGASCERARQCSSGACVNGTCGGGDLTAYVPGGSGLLPRSCGCQGGDAGAGPLAAFLTLAWLVRLGKRGHSTFPPAGAGGRT